MADAREETAAIYDAMAALKKVYGSEWQLPPRASGIPAYRPLYQLMDSAQMRLDMRNYRTKAELKHDARSLIVTATLNAYAMAADEYRWEHSDALQAATREIAQARAEHDDEVAHVEPARGTRALLQQIGQLASELLKRDPDSFARRIRKADIGEVITEIRDLNISELETWVQQADETLGERY